MAQAKWFKFISSMEVAIALLVIVAMASVIGTVVQQNQPYIDYSLKFGPFWFELFGLFGFYDIYSQIWFISILAFLTVSTTSCVIRNTKPTLIAIKKHQAEMNQQQLLQCPIKRSFSFNLDEHQFNQAIQAVRQQLGINLRKRSDLDDNQSTIWAAIASRFQKSGYFLTHLGVIVICIGAIADSNFYLKIAEWRGDLRHESRNVLLDDINPAAWLEPDNLNFRGTVTIPEGRSANVLFLPWKDGYLVQKLPFFVRLLDFRTEYYPTGQPKSFESDLALFDLNETLITTQTISVNKPLSHAGITIYQSSFEDGGSILQLELNNLLNNTQVPIEISVNSEQAISLFKTPLQLELTDFRHINVVPRQDDPTKFRNQGPSFNYKIRDPQGQAFEYHNFMQPQLIDEHLFYLSGVRRSPADPFRYLHIPADDNMLPNLFFDLVARLNNPTLTSADLQGSPFLNDFPQFQQGNFLPVLLKAFVQNGLTPIQAYVERVDAADKERLEETLIELLRLSFAEVFFSMLTENQSPFAPFVPTDRQLDYLEDAFTAVNALSQYQYPLFFELQQYDLIEASGLQMTKSSAKAWVYLGCLMLVVGIFIMFYLPRSSVWLLYGADTITIAMMDQKNLQTANAQLDKIGNIIDNISNSSLPVSSTN